MFQTPAVESDLSVLSADDETPKAVHEPMIDVCRLSRSKCVYAALGKGSCNAANLPFQEALSHHLTISDLHRNTSTGRDPNQIRLRVAANAVATSARTVPGGCGCCPFPRASAYPLRLP